MIEELLRHRLPAIRRRRPPGTAPGELSIDPGLPTPTLRLMAYGPERLHEAQIEDPAAVATEIGRWPVVWVDVDGLGDEQMLRTLGEKFGVHRLALEDVVNVHQRAKVEPYDDHLFIVARMIREQEDQLATEQVSLIVGSNYVVTFQERPGDSFDPVRHRLRTGHGRVRRAGADYLAYALLDALIDAYFPVLERFGDRLEGLELDVLERPDAASVVSIHLVKRELLVVRRAIWPHREAVAALLRGDTPFVTDDTRVYLRDAYDHVIQVVDLVETYRELASGLLDLHLTSISNRMNEIMKVLTIFAAIFIPLSFIAGLYGMNFEPSRWNMPELRLPFGYPLVLVVMSVVALGLLVFFRQRGWLGGRRARSRREGPTDA